MDSHATRLDRCRLSLEGLSIGDAFGDQCFRSPGMRDSISEGFNTGAAPWPWTDDSNMACSVYAVLNHAKLIDEDLLAASFLRRFDMSRGYGPSANRMLRSSTSAAELRTAAKAQFGGEGSCGNGSSMRAGPIGAYFADELACIAEQAKRSSLVTHTHLEAIAGATAVAIAAAVAWQTRDESGLTAGDFLERVLQYLSPSEVSSKIRRAQAMRESTEIAHAAAMLGNGAELAAQDTVPFALWCAAKRQRTLLETLALAVQGGGDMDTICAIAGSIVSLRIGQEGIPDGLRAAREPLPDWFWNSM